MTEFRMPSLGSDMEAGTLVEQAVSAGDVVHSGDVIGAVETQKGVIEIEIFEDGTFGHWLAEIGQTVPVGAPLAVIRVDGDEGMPSPKEPEPAPPQSTSPKRIPISSEPEPTEATDQIPTPPPIAPEMPTEIESQQKTVASDARRRITPAARRLAAARGIDVSVFDRQLKEPITRRDVEAIKSPNTAEGTPDFRSAIAAAMARSKREIPHYYLSHDVDLTAAESFVSTQNANRKPTDRLLIGALCAKATAAAAAKFPEFNGHYTSSGFEPSKAVHLGFAINVRSGGLVAPALFDAEDLSLDDLMQNLRDLSQRVRAGRFRARELSDATITLTSLGERGTDVVFGVIYPPQVAIVGMGAARARPAVVDGDVVVRSTTTLTLAADHRVSDGHRGALFLRAIDKYLQTPENL